MSAPGRHGLTPNFFLFPDYPQMNKLWVRMQHQGPAREKARPQPRPQNLPENVSAGSAAPAARLPPTQMPHTPPSPPAGEAREGAPGAPRPRREEPPRPQPAGGGGSPAVPERGAPAHPRAGAYEGRVLWVSLRVADGIWIAPFCGSACVAAMACRLRCLAYLRLSWWDLGVLSLFVIAGCQLQGRARAAIPHGRSDPGAQKQLTPQRSVVKH